MDEASGRAAIAARLVAWRDGALDAAALQKWAEQALAASARMGDEVVAEALADLDLLHVHLLTPADVPALLALLERSDLEAWRRHRDGIDLDARSRELRRVPLYRPFCRSGGGGR